MPGTDGLTATETLRRRPGAPEVVILTTFDADEHVLRALRAGAAGFILKDTPPGRDRRVRTPGGGRPAGAVPRGHQAPDQPGRRIRPGPAQGEGGRLAWQELNDREREIAVAVGEGKSNAEISATLYLSVPTVKTHVSRILTKLDLNNRVQIALLVHDAGLLDDTR